MIWDFGQAGGKKATILHARSVTSAIIANTRDCRIVKAFNIRIENIIMTMVYI